MSTTKAKAKVACYPTGRYSLRLVSSRRRTLEQACSSWPLRSQDRISPINEWEQPDGTHVFVAYASLQNLNAKILEHTRMLSSLIGYHLQSDACQYSGRGLSVTALFEERREALVPTVSEQEEIDSWVTLLREVVGEVVMRGRRGKEETPAYINWAVWQKCQSCGYVAHDIPDLVVHMRRSCEVAREQADESMK